MNVANLATPKKILLVVEDSPQLGAVVNMITQIKWPAGSSIFLLAVVPEQLPLMDTRFEARTQVDEATEIDRWRGWAATKLLADQVSAKLRARHLTIEHTEVCAGSLVELALECGQQISPDLIMLGDQPFCEPGHIWLNPSTNKLAQCAPHSVLVVRPSKPIYPLRTILAVDNSAAAWQAINFARSLSLPDWARVTLLYLSGEPNDPTCQSSTVLPQHPQDIAEPFATEAISYLHDCGVAVRWLFRQGHPVSQLLSVAQEQEANLIVMGASESTPVAALPRPSITQNIVKNAPCSVLVVRQQNELVESS